MRSINLSLLHVATLITIVLTMVGCAHQSIDVPQNISRRIGIMIPGSTEPSEPVVLEHPGLYYLAGNRYADSNGIEIRSHDVTIDLNGFVLTGPGRDSGKTMGIHMHGRNNVEIRNGTIRDFGHKGIHESSTEASNKRIINVRVINNGGCGICVWGHGNLIKDCSCSDNKGGGICSGGGAVVTGNTSYRNGSGGIEAGFGSVVTANAVHGSGSKGISAYQGASIVNNTLYGNNQSGKEKGAGLFLTQGCLVKNNTFRNNKKCHIYVEGRGNVIEGNVLTQQTDEPCIGIYFKTADNIHEDNKTFGIDTPLAGNIPTESDESDIESPD